MKKFVYLAVFVLAMQSLSLAIYDKKYCDDRNNAFSWYYGEVQKPDLDESTKKVYNDSMTKLQNEMQAANCPIGALECPDLQTAYSVQIKAQSEAPWIQQEIADLKDKMTKGLCTIPTSPAS